MIIFAPSESPWIFGAWSMISAPSLLMFGARAVPCARFW